jgi:AcrR family transcriptional regulator
MPSVPQQKAAHGVAGAGSRREQILEAAEAAFGDHGFRGTSLADIAARAGLTQQGVLHYFASKSHLLLAVLERRQDADVDRFWNYGGSSLDALIQLARDNEARPGIIRLFVQLSAEGVDLDNPGHAWWTDRYAMMRSLVEDALRKDQVAGVVAAGVDVRLAAIQLIAIMDGLQLQWALAPDQIDTVEVLSSFLATLRARPDVAHPSEL